MKLPLCFFLIFLLNQHYLDIKLLQKDCYQNTQEQPKHWREEPGLRIRTNVVKEMLSRTDHRPSFSVYLPVTRCMHEDLITIAS